MAEHKTLNFLAAEHGSPITVFVPTPHTSPRAVYVLRTGGTIEKMYSENSGSVSNRENKIDRYLRLLRLPDIEVDVVPLMNKDSLEMTDQDRVLILGMVRAILKENAPIVIAYGTDTMVETGPYLQRLLPEFDVPIVLTGAMTPLGFEGSDGLQNLTESLLAVQLVPPGVYVLMHGTVIPANQAKEQGAREICVDRVKAL
jgi:L-asparaginase